jgi:hypothetical protein
MPGYHLTAWLRPLMTLAALAGVLSLAACGGGSGSPSSMSGSVGVPLAITPATATVYSGNPFTFLVTGGTQPYSVLSSDQAALPVVGTLTGNTLVVVPGSVGADTAVTLSIRDASGQTASAAVTVRPALLLPASITITGNPNCGASGATLCSGQDGTASVVLTGPAGAPLAGRQVRFDVVQGDFSISSTTPGQPLVQTLTVTTDQNGAAAVRLVVPTTAATQFATIRATDVTGGSSVVGQFTISQFINGNSVLSVIPTGVTTFTGPDTARCSAGASATFYVFGGTPPYTIATNFPTAISISGAPVLRSGGGFTITTNGTCFTGLTFAITDANGRTLLTPPTASNVLGTAAPAPAPIVLTPASLLPASCSPGSQLGQILATGGTGTFVVAVAPAQTNPGIGGPVIAAVSGGQISVSVQGPSTIPPGTTASGDFAINVSSGSAAPVAAIVHCP